MPTSFPQLNSFGLILQRPYSEGTVFRTSVNDQESGKRYARAWFTAPNPALAVTPGVAFKTFKAVYPVITRAEVTILENFFDTLRGGWDYFYFSDQDGVIRTCRLSSSKFEVSYDNPGWHSLSMEFDEIFPTASVGGASLTTTASFNTGSFSRHAMRPVFPSEPDPGPPTSVLLTVWASYTPNGLSASTRGSPKASWSLQGSPKFPVGPSPSPAVMVLPTDVDLFSLRLGFEVGYLGPGIAMISYPESWNIFDAYVTVEHKAFTRKFRAFSAFVSDGGGSYGSVTNPRGANDSDTSPPHTAASVNRWTFSENDEPVKLTLANFTAPFE